MSAIIYLLQASACLALFYGFYYLMLSRLTFFTINRYYLLFTLLFSFAVPLLTITVHQQYEGMPVMQQVENIRSFKTITYYVPSHTTTPITWMQLLKYGYLLAVAGLFIHLFFTLLNFFIKLKRRKLSSLGNVHILRGDKSLPNGSFLNYIFLNDDEINPEEMQQIISHEMLHVKLYHSADRLLMKVVQIILWFNPFVYLYARSMEENHEFEVDREMGLQTDKTKYADLLLHLSVAKQGMLYHNFSMVPLKKRITMLFNKPSAKVKRIIYVLVLPVMMISCLAFAKIKKDDIKNFSLVKTTKKLITAVKTGQENIVEQLNQPVQLPAVIQNAQSIKTININTTIQPHIIPVTVNDTMRYSVFGNISKNATLTIDGKEYPHDMLYEISKSGIQEISLGTNIVSLKTVNGQFKYLTAHEKENLRKERTTPISQFYTRLQLTDDNGERYDYIVIRVYNAVGRDDQNQFSNIPGSFHRAIRIAPDYKVGFMINGQLYSEDEIKTIPPATIFSLNSYASATYKPDMLYQNKYNCVFTLNSPAYQQLQNNNPATDIPKAANDKTFRNYVFASYPVDTIAFKAQPYKEGLNPNAALFELVKKLPNFTTKENTVYFGDKVINDLYINKAEYSGWVIQGLKSLPAGNVTEIRITSPDKKNLNPAIMYIITGSK